MEKRGYLHEGEDESGAPSDPVTEIAIKRFGIGYLYPFQRLVIANVIDGVDQIVIFPTGGGKSLCFQVPSLFLSGATLVVMPLLALISDQVRSLSEKKISTAVIKGGQSEAERRSIFDSIAAGSVKLVFSTPEALLSGRTLEELRNVTISHLVIDEAHCISEWGESFRPCYLDLHKLHETLPISIVTAFTATASAEVTQKIRELLYRERPVAAVMANPDRPNIFYRVRTVISKNHAIARLVTEKEKPLIVFTRSRKGAERVARMLASRFPDTGIRFYHAGLEHAERKAVEQWFLASTDGVLVSTCAYGLGVDKPNVRTIIHADVPPSAEAYLQESGRAGRDKEKSEAMLIFSDEDTAFLAAIRDETQKLRYERILDYALSNDRCRRESILSLLDYALAEPCSGCDVCAHESTPDAEGEKAILAFVRKTRRRYTLREALYILVGARSYHVEKYRLHAVKGFGTLAEWDIDDIEEAIARLVAQGKIVIPKKGFWKRRLTIGINRNRI